MYIHIYDKLSPRFKIKILSYIFIIQGYVNICMYTFLLLTKAVKDFPAEKPIILFCFHYSNADGLPSEMISSFKQQQVVIRVCIPQMVPKLFVNQILSILKSFPNQA